MSNFGLEVITFTSRAAAPAPAATPLNVFSTTPRGMQLPKGSLVLFMGRPTALQLVDRLSNRLMANGPGHGGHVDPDRQYLSETLVDVRKRLNAGEWGTVSASLLPYHTPTGCEEAELAMMIADLLSRPETPCRLPVPTVGLLTGLTRGTLRGLVRKGELIPRREVYGRIHYDATGLERALRQHYCGNPIMDGIERLLLLEPKYCVDQQTAGLLGIDLETLQNVVSAGTLPSIQVGKSTRLVKSDLDRFLALSRSSEPARNTPGFRTADTGRQGDIVGSAQSR